ncbi:IclR family transcriptional regulator [Metapseudomonas furukawaii]|uniref:HTH-type transcriptional repressor AllR n=1 Tax=Metapseudomonas furukawaii TaxID=1149133 RepID=A0AAD1FFH3_METFU|nr:IclR family transcriptional regulator [Pseudomonas furukawaii]ELS28737.1 Transcriptional regulator, IclR family [Pseudomonas furukawaii]BAU73513.1 transcriptional regulator [Pseudomonas furukawaii]
MTYTNPTDRLLQILVALGQAPDPVSAKELSLNLGQPLSSTYRHLKTLLRWGLAEEQAGTGRYLPGPTCLQLAKKFDREGLLVTLAKPELRRLAELSLESVALMVPGNGQVICIELIDSPQPLRCCYQKGLAQPLLRGASAKTLLAFMSEDECRSLLVRQGVEGRDLEDLEAELRQVRQQGHAVSLGEIDDGVWGVSAPVVDGKGRLQGAISLMAPALRVQARADWLVRWTRECAGRISARLG